MNPTGITICLENSLIEPWNQPLGAGAVGIVLAAKLRTQQPLFRSDAREERRYNERREQHADPRMKGEDTQNGRLALFGVNEIGH